MRRQGFRRLAALAGLALPAATGAGAAELASELDRAAAAVEPQVIAWRRDIHAHPELSNREFRTAARVAEQLEALGLEVRTGLAHTGVVGVLRGSRRSPVVALRADMDALPVTEELALPFASRVRARLGEREVGVMHACGHDAHTAMLLGAAQVLAGARERLPGTLVFVFQPAEERPPPGEEGGARLLLAEGGLRDPAPDAIFGLHVVPEHAAGSVAYRAGGAMASSDKVRILVRGRQTHAARPWRGVDAIAVASRIVLALQAIPGRQTDVRSPALISIGSIHGGVRHNIIPEEVELLGTIRAFDPEVRRELHERMRRTVDSIAESAGASAAIEMGVGYPSVYNDPELTRRMLPTLVRVAGPDAVIEGLPRTGAEDFAFYQQEMPGLFLWLGIRPPDVAEADAEPNHSPRFFVDESALVLGVRLLAHLASDFLHAGAATDP